MRAVYDKSADVLYVNVGRSVPIEGDGLPGGVELDYNARNGKPCGVTVIGLARNDWLKNLPDLAAIASKHLSVDVDRATGVISKAIEAEQ